MKSIVPPISNDDDIGNKYSVRVLANTNDIMYLPDLESSGYPVEIYHHNEYRRPSSDEYGTY
jgi:hypothetical protein